MVWSFSPVSSFTSLTTRSRNFSFFPVDLILSNEDIQATYNYEKIPDGAVADIFNKLIPVGMAASAEKEKNRVINQAVEYAFANCGAEEGGELTQEHKPSGKVVLKKSHDKTDENFGKAIDAFGDEEKEALNKIDLLLSLAPKGVINEFIESFKVKRTTEETKEDSKYVLNKN